MLSTLRVKLALSEAELAPQRAEIFRRLLSLGLAAGGIGAAGRTLVDVLSPPAAIRMPFVSPGPSPLEVPVPTTPEPQQKRQRVLKLAHELAKQSDWAAELGKKWPHLVAKLPIIGPGLNTLEAAATHAGNAWWTAPASVATGAAGLAGGYGLANFLLNRQRKNRVDDELTRAKKLYQEALLAEGTKQAGEGDPINAKLDQVFDELEKRANLYASSWNPVTWLGVGGDLGNSVMGAYITALGALTGGAGYAGYRWAKSRSPAALAEKAMKERGRRLWQTSSQPIEAVPVQVPAQENASAA